MPQPGRAGWRQDSVAGRRRPTSRRSEIATCGTIVNPIFAAGCPLADPAQSGRSELPHRVDTGIQTHQPRISGSVQVFGRRRHEGGGCFGGRRPKSAKARSRGEVWRLAGSQRYGDLILTPAIVAGAKVAPIDLDGVWRGLEARNRDRGGGLELVNGRSARALACLRRGRSPPAWSQRNVMERRRR